MRRLAIAAALLKSPPEPDLAFSRNQITDGENFDRRRQLEQRY